MEKYLIIWLKESAGAVCVLHSDKHFYRSFISCRGCDVVTYKTRAAAEKKARAYSYNKDGVIIPVLSSELEQLEKDFYNDRRAVLARYTAPAELLPAFEDAQTGENGVITCRIQSAGITGISQDFDVLLSKRADVFGWETAVLIVTNHKYYDNNGKFSGRPVFVIRPADLPDVSPCNLFDMLRGNGSFTNKLSGVDDWETREKWLSHFTEEEKATAVQIEKYLQTLTQAA